MPDEVFDANGKPLHIGAEVQTVGPPMGERGIVKRISDWDGDMRDGRMVGLPPRVYVQWPEFEDGDPEVFIAGMRPDERTHCDDLEAVAPRGHPTYCMCDNCVLYGEYPTGGRP